MGGSQSEMSIEQKEGQRIENSITASPTFWKDGFEEFLSSGLFSDVTIVETEHTKEFKAHRVILVRKSQYFRKLLLGGFKEEGLSRVEVRDPSNSLELILHYIYTGELQVDPENVASLLDGAELFAVEGLTRYILELVQTQLDSNKDLIFAYFNRGHESRLACTEYIRDNFSELVEGGCFKRLQVTILAPETLCEILSSDSLATKHEDEVCTAVISYINNNRNALNFEQIRQLISTPRYQYTRSETLLKMHMEFREFLPKDFLDVLVVKVCQQTELKIPTELLKSNPRKSYGIVFFHPRSSSDHQGLFYWLGQNKGLDAWQNPVIRGLVAISCSSCWGGAGGPDPTICGLGSQSHTFFWTNNEHNGWIRFDVDPKSNCIKFIPTHYVYGFQTNMWMPRNWNFEGSLDGQQWDILKEHQNDLTIQAQSNHMFEVHTDNSYRFFRLRVTGPDSTGTNYLGLSSFEMFGRVVRG